MAEEEHVGPGSHSPLKSFWPGWSSGPCPSLMQTARTGAAVRRPNASVTADSHHTQTTFCVVAVTPPQRNHPRADLVVFLELVIFCPLRSDRVVLRQTFLREFRERALWDRGEGRPVGPGHTRYEVARELLAEKISRERRLRDTPVVERLRAVAGRSGAEVGVGRHVAIEGNEVRSARHPPVCMAGSKHSTTGTSEARETAEVRQGVKLADMHDVVTFVRLCHA